MKNIHPSKEQLKFGIICQNKTIFEWQKKCLKNLLKTHKANGPLFILNLNPPQKIKNNYKKNIFDNNFNNILYELSYKFLTKLTENNKIDISSNYKNTLKLNTSLLNQEDQTNCLPQKTINKVKQFNPDFVINFTPKSLNGELLKIPNYGIWAFFYGYYQLRQPKMAYFWEIYNNNPASIITLQKITTDPNSNKILQRGTFKTKNIVPNNNYPNHFDWPAQACMDILKDRNKFYDNKYKTPDKISRNKPTKREILFFIFNLMINNLKKIYRKFLRRKWNIGLVKQPISKILKDNSSPKVEWFPEIGANNFIADPFGIEKNNKKVVFFENYNININKGHIETAEIDNMEIKNFKENCAQEISLPHHISYPFVFEYKNDFFCFPETNAANEIALYKLNSKNNQWQKEKIILQKAGMDPTPLFLNNNWWLFFTKPENNSNLFVYTAKNLMGPWHAHSSNPVKTDVTSARPGGTPFKYKNNIYRPAQDCSQRYGGRLALNKIKKISLTEFEEKTVSFIEPVPPYNKGLHTLSKIGNYTLLDGKKLEFNFSTVWERLKNKLFRLSDLIK